MNRELLDKVARSHSYEQGFNGRLAKYRIEILRTALGTRKDIRRVLEVGCGEGSITEFLANTFGDVTALEPAEAFYERAKQKLAGTSVQIRQEMMEQYRTDVPFDLCVAAGVLEHVEDIASFLAAVRSCLTPSGLFAVTVPNAGSLHRRIGKEMGIIRELTDLGPLDRSVGHFRYYLPETLRKDLVTSGFRVLELGGIMIKPFPNSEMDSLSEETCDAMFRVGKDFPELCAEIYGLFQRDGYR